MSAAPLFSIITVCLNARATLPRVVACLTAQTCQDFEWVVMDGGSTDGSFEFVQQAQVLKGPCRCGPDQGIYDAMNRGIQHARGSWIFFLNADDVLADSRVLEDMAAQIRTRTEVQFWWGDVIYRQTHDALHMRFAHLNRWSLPFEFICHQSIFVHKQVFEHVGDFRLRWWTSADYDWCLRVFLAGIPRQYWGRTVAEFQDGGMHTRDPEARELERAQLRLQYMRPWQLWLGSTVSRVLNKLSRWCRQGLAVGQRRWSAPPPWR